MNNLRDFLENKYFIKHEEQYSFEIIASDILNFLNADIKNYFDITGFAMDFYLADFLTQNEKKDFYNELKSKGFFKRLNTFLYSDDLSICSWAIYTIGKFSNNENAKYLEEAYETNFSLTNPILAYRCLIELNWLNSKKLGHYLSKLEIKNSKTSKLILLYYWETSNDNSKFNQLLKDKALLNFIEPNQTLMNKEKEICNRLFGFERHISELYNAIERNIIDKNRFESIAKYYFKTYLKSQDTLVDKDHQDFLKQFGGE